MAVEFRSLGSRHHVTLSMALASILGGAILFMLLHVWLESRQPAKGSRLFRLLPVIASGLVLPLVLPWLGVLLLLAVQALWGWLPPAGLRQVLLSSYPPNEWHLLLWLVASFLVVIGFAAQAPTRLTLHLDSESRWWTWWPWVLFAVFVFVFGSLNVMQLLAGHMGFHDGGFAAEGLHHTLHGKFLHSNSFKASPLIADHFAPLVLVLVPLAAILPIFPMLCVVSAISLGLAIPLTWRLAMKYTGSPLTAAVFSLAVFLYPPLTTENSSFTYGFQTEHLSVPILLAALYYLPMNREYSWTDWTKLAGLLFVALLSRETVALPVLLCGMYVLWRTRSWRYSLPLIITALLWGWAIPNVVVPWLRGGEYYLIGYYYSKLGESLGDVLVNVATHPWILLQRLAHPQALFFLVIMILPLGGSALARLDLLAIGSATFFFLLIADSLHFLSYNQHYKCTILPIVILASVAGYPTVEAWLARRFQTDLTMARQGWMCGILVIAFASAWLFGAGPLTRGYRPELFDWRNGKAMDARYLAGTTPTDAVVYASQRMGSFLAEHPRLYIVGADLPAVVPPPDLLVIDTRYDWGDSERNQQTVEMYATHPDYVTLARYSHVYVIIRKELLGDPKWQALVRGREEGR